MNIQIAGSQRGFTLTEALVAFAITAIGLLAIVSFQAGLFTQSANSKARAEALSLAQQKLEEFKHYTLADQDNFIDENLDGIMDADGNYVGNVITGQNAEFTRAWNIATAGENKQIDVTVSWTDSSNQPQSVLLSAELPWISPRAGVDLSIDPEDPSIKAPTGRARLGEGNLADYPAGELSPKGSPSLDGLSTYQHKDNLLLVDSSNNILLTLLDACATTEGTCTNFVRISGTVYLDRANPDLPKSLELEDIFVIASDAAYCERWVPDGTLSSPAETESGDYEYYNYTCYLGGGWHGNIGFVTSAGIKQTNKVCQGDPVALNAWEQPVIALRRSYRGMLAQDVSGQVLYTSHGIKDATELTGHDYVFTHLLPEYTEGSYCNDVNAPMTRPDSGAGRLFAGVPTDFFCLNVDINGDSVPDYLDAYDPLIYSASVGCPYDPTEDPPVTHHVVSGLVTVATGELADLSNFRVTTSDGPGNCEWDKTFSLTANGYQASYSCKVYDWGDGWSGYVELQPNTNFVYCDNSIQEFVNLVSDTSQDFKCIGSGTVVIEGNIYYGRDTAIDAITIEESVTARPGSCRISDNAYRCVAPYSGESWSGVLNVLSSSHVCGSVDGSIVQTGLIAEKSPYWIDLYVAKNAGICPAVPISP